MEDTVYIKNKTYSCLAKYVFFFIICNFCRKTQHSVNNKYHFSVNLVKLLFKGKLNFLHPLMIHIISLNERKIC